MKKAKSIRISADPLGDALRALQVLSDDQLRAVTQNIQSELRTRSRERKEAEAKRKADLAEIARIADEQEKRDVLASHRNTRWLDKVAADPRVDGVTNEGIDNGFWVYLKDGWFNPSLGCHMIHEWKKQDVLSQLARIEPCEDDCECKRQAEPVDEPADVVLQLRGIAIHGGRGVGPDAEDF